MKTCLHSGVLIFILVLATPCLAQGPAKNGWYSDYPTARAVAQKAGKPLFVVFRCQP
jgi:hypothetical protein